MEKTTVFRFDSRCEKCSVHMTTHVDAETLQYHMRRLNIEHLPKLSDIPVQMFNIHLCVHCSDEIRKIEYLKHLLVVLDDKKLYGEIKKILKEVDIIDCFIKALELEEQHIIAKKLVKTRDRLLNNATPSFGTFDFDGDSTI